MLYFRGLGRKESSMVKASVLVVKHDVVTQDPMLGKTLSLVYDFVATVLKFFIISKKGTYIFIFY